MANKAIFLDRDNTIIEDPGYINNPDQVKLLPGVTNALIQFREMGYKLIVVTNQSAVARGIVTEKVLAQIHDKLKELLTQAGASLDRIYYCPYHPDGVVAKYRKQSDMRKPNPGMLLAAAKEFDIEFSLSWMIGNSYSDIAAGQRAGTKTILINSALNETYRKPSDPVPDKKAVNIKEAVNIIKMYKRSDRIPTKIAIKAQPAEPSGVQTTPPGEQPVEDKKVPRKTATPKTLAKPAARTDTRQTNTNDKSMHSEKTHQLLEEMVRHLKNIHRADMFEEFSIAKLIAGALQVLACSCLALSLVLLLLSNTPVSTIHTTIGYAIVLQLMAIAFYIMRDRK